MPNSIARTFRWVPLWTGIVTLPIWAAFFSVVLINALDGPNPSLRDALIPTPLFLLFGCGVLACFSSTTVRVSADGIEVQNGPLPFTLPNFRLPLSEVDACYSRLVPRSGKGGGAYFTAGVRAKDGRHYDVLSPLRSAEEASQGATEIGRIVVATTHQGLDCLTYGVFPIPQDRSSMLRALGWIALLVPALAFAIALELTR